MLYSRRQGGLVHLSTNLAVLGISNAVPMITGGDLQRQHGKQGDTQ
jgi:hypothetical protein